MDGDIVVPVPDDGLGNASYLVDLGDGRALAVDACRDLRALRRVADARGLRIAFAADTHLHADFVGTVKSQTSRALSRLRQLMALDEPWTQTSGEA